MMKGNFKTINEYIKLFPKDVQAKLRLLRKTVHELVPKATEAIKYQMPTFVLHGNLLHFAAYEKHIGFYPTPYPIQYFKKDLLKYKTSKGAIQFPLNEPLPLPLIKKIITLRIKQSMIAAKIR